MEKIQVYSFSSTEIGHRSSFGHTVVEIQLLVLKRVRCMKINAGILACIKQ